MYGVKGHSVLSLYIDIVRDIYMHMILEEISKMLLNSSQMEALSIVAFT